MDGRMKRFLSLLLIVLLAACFVSCGDDDTTTTINITQPTATTTAGTSAEPVTDANGMVLTTAFGQTVPTVETTPFDIDAEATATSFVVPGDDLTIPIVTPPVVVTDVAPTTYLPSTTTQYIFPSDDQPSSTDRTEPSSTAEGGSSTDVSGTDTSETQYNPDDGEQNKLPICESSAYDGKNLTLSFNYADWDRIKSQKATVKVTYNGKTKSCKGTINGVDENNQFFFVVDVSDLNIPEEDYYVEVTFPKGAIKSINGNQSSQAFTAVASME